MKRKVLTYNQYINERFGFKNFDIDKANKIAERLFKSTNSEIVDKIIKHKDKLIPLLKKYTKDGKIILNKVINKDQNVSESINMSNLFDAFKKIDKKLYEFFIDIKNLIIKEIKFAIKEVGSFFSSLTAGFLIWLMGTLMSMGISTNAYGINNGTVVSQVKMEKGYNKNISITTVDSNGDENTSNYTQKFPDTWTFEVEDSKGNVEKWSTSNKKMISNIEEGDRLNSKDFICVNDLQVTNDSLSLPNLLKEYKKIKDLNFIVRQFSFIASEVGGEDVEWSAGHIENLELGYFVPKKEISDALREVMIRKLYPEINISDVFDEEIKNDDEPITIIAKPERIVDGTPPNMNIKTDNYVFRNYHAYSKSNPDEYLTHKESAPVTFNIDGNVITYEVLGRRQKITILNPSLIYRNGKLAYIESKQTDSDIFDYVLISIEENWVKMKGESIEYVYY